MRSLSKDLAATAHFSVSSFVLIWIAHILAFMLFNSSSTGPASPNSILPPELPWSGKSKSLLIPATDSWATPFEQSGLNQTPRYDETVAWLQKLVDAAPELERVSIGTTLEGRDIVMILASSARRFSPQDFVASEKATVLIQACIHAGEPDGKDAGLMLLRDMTVKGSKHDLLEKVNVMFVPIYNADGHERSSRFGRINQRGPLETGWRTNARNLNLNRDYAKLDAPETRSIVRVMNQWQPGSLSRSSRHGRGGLSIRYYVGFRLKRSIFSVDRQMV